MCDAEENRDKMLAPSRPRRMEPSPRYICLAAFVVQAMRALQALGEVLYCEGLEVSSTSTSSASLGACNAL